MNVESFVLDNWKEKYTGAVIAENHQWLLVAHIPVDFVIDGYRLYAKKFLISRTNSTEERLIERVLKLRKINIEVPVRFLFDEAPAILKWSQDTYGLFEFQDNSESELFYGRIYSVIENELVIDFVDSKGIVDDEYDSVFKIDEIRTISFQSDYFQSVCALWRDEHKATSTL